MLSSCNSRHVLVFRPGSIGDTAVSVPAFHLIKQAFPEAKVTVLSNEPVSSLTGGPETLLSSSKLVADFMTYPVRPAVTHAWRQLVAQIRSSGCDSVVYLGPVRESAAIIRYRLFFYAAGIYKHFGFSTRAGSHLLISQEPLLYEHETARLLRRLSRLGTVDRSSKSVWDIRLTEAEHSAAEHEISKCNRSAFKLCFSRGGKVPVNQWPEKNWQELFVKLGQRHPEIALLACGGQADFGPSQSLLEYWPEEKLNLCGKLSARATVAALQSCSLFVGHDSGPIHLAALAGIPCVGIYSSRNRPGIWYPFGQHHTVLYSHIDCQGCLKSICPEYQARCIRSIEPQTVFAAISEQVKRIKIASESAK